MPVGYDNRGQPTPVSETFGLGQRGRLVSASETTYREALERMFRSRLTALNALRKVADAHGLCHIGAGLQTGHGEDWLPRAGHDAGQQLVQIPLQVVRSVDNERVCSPQQEAELRHTAQ